jgi:MFS family permease
MIAVLLGIYLPRRGLDAAEVGLVITAGLAGAALATLVATMNADRLGRRRFLIIVAVLTAIGGIGVALAPFPITLALAAFVGMVNGMGRDRGASAVIEQSVLPATTPDHERTRAFAWYNVAQDAGHALGALIAGVPVVLRGLAVDELAAMQLGLALYVMLSLVPAVLYARLSPVVETARTEPQALSPATRRILWRIGSLFALDAIAGGFLTATLLTVFFHERFQVGVATIGALFFAARIANAWSHVGAAWLARRIGLVNTMVFTHIPSSLLLVTVAYAPTFPIAAVLFLVREALVEMDVPTRQSYVVAVVAPHERTRATGITQLVRMGGWAVAPVFAGLLMQGTSLALPLIIGAFMKVAYDILLYAAFRNLKPPEEREPRAPL